MKYEKIVVPSDFHVPFHDRQALSAFISFCKYFKPDKIFLNGDIIDFYAISRFTKDPGRALELQQEIDEAVGVLKMIRKANPKAEIHYIKGNHEARLQRYLWSEAKELAGLKILTVEHFLQLKSLNIIYHEQGRCKYSGITIKHGSVVRKYSGYTAKAEVEKNGVSGISGHCFDEKTEILTKRGWVKGFNLKCNDLVGTMNKQSREFEWNNINKFYSFDNYTNLYHIKGITTDIMVTDKHGLIYENEKGKLKEICAKDMANINGTMRFFNSVESNYQEQFISVEKNRLRLLINIVTDGSFDDNAIRWHLKKERKIKHLLSLLNYLGLEYSHHIQKNGNSKIRLSVKDSKHFIDIIGEKKVLPKFIVNLKPELVGVILDEYSITDGCKNKSAVNSYQITSHKEQEIDILQEMFVRNGYRATKTIHGNGFILTVNTNGTCGLIKNNVSIEEYSGKVWCINVDNGTLLVRRNGKVSVTLNTHRASLYFQNNEGQEIVWAESGCMCQLDAEYLEGEVPNWLSSFIVGHFKKDSKRFNLTVVPIIRGKAMYNGMEFK